MKCTQCHVDKPVSEFYERHSRCKRCLKENGANYYAQNKHKWKAYNKRAHRKFREWYNSLKEGPCTDCGGEFDPVCMQWDHLGDKVDSVGRIAFTQSKTLVLEEIAKCDLVCANCHALRTKNRKESDEFSR